MRRSISPGKLLSLVLTVGLAAIAVGAAAESKVYQRVAATPGEPPPASLSEFLAKLNQAVEAGDVSVIVASVSDDFQCLKDHGGDCDEGMNASEKFSAISGVSPEAGGDSNATALAALRRLLAVKQYALTTAHGAANAPLLCGPAVPKFDEKLIASTEQKVFGGDGEAFWFEWVAVTGESVPVHGKPSADAPALEKLSRELVRADTTVPRSDGWIAVDLPSGTRGYVREADVIELLPRQLCFTQQPSGAWQISAFVGGGD
jgi:hypothetical protein